MPFKDKEKKKAWQLEYQRRPEAKEKARKSRLKRKENPVYREKIRSRQYQLRYGITLEDYERRYLECQGCCEICGIKQKVLHVDHCHKTNIVRGLLCSPCNVAIGLFTDDPDKILKAAEYVKRFRLTDLNSVVQ